MAEIVEILKKVVHQQHQAKEQRVTQRTGLAGLWPACAAMGLLCFGSSLLAAEGPPRRGGAGPADPPPEYRNPPQEIDVPSVVRGQTAGIEVGQYAPDFELQPIEPYAKLREWLVDEAREVVFYPRPRRFRGLGLLPRWRGGARVARIAYTRPHVNDAESVDVFQNVKLSQLVGKAPILLLYGSYT